MNGSVIVNALAVESRLRLYSMQFVKSVDGKLDKARNFRWFTLAKTSLNLRARVECCLSAMSKKRCAMKIAWFVDLSGQCPHWALGILGSYPGDKPCT